MVILRNTFNDTGSRKTTCEKCNETENTPKHTIFDCLGLDNIKPDEPDPDEDLRTGNDFTPFEIQIMKRIPELQHVEKKLKTCSKG